VAKETEKKNKEKKGGGGSEMKGKGKWMTKKCLEPRNTMALPINCNVQQSH